MVTQPLVDAADLDGFPGAPFPAGVLKSAAGQVRDQCGWHIAPAVTETAVKLPTGGGTVVLLPSLQVDTVTEVRNADDGTVLDNWKVYSNGVLKRTTVWPERIEVDYTHGFAECPDSLLPVIAERAQSIRGQRVKQESLASRSVTLDNAPGSSANEKILARFTLPERP